MSSIFLRGSFFIESSPPPNIYELCGSIVFHPKKNPMDTKLIFLFKCIRQSNIWFWFSVLIPLPWFQGGKVGRVKGAVPGAQGRRLHPHGSQVERQIRADADALLNLSLGKQKWDPQVLAEPHPWKELRHGTAGGGKLCSRKTFIFHPLFQVAILAQNKHHDSILTLLMKNHEVFRETRQLFFKIFM